MNSTHDRCTTSSPNDLIFDIITISLRFIIPSILMIIFTGLIVTTVNKSKKKTVLKDKSKNSSSLGTISQQAGGKKKSKEASLTSTVVRMNILFIVLNTPVSIVMLIINFYSTDYDEIFDATVGNLYLLTFEFSNVYYSFRLVWNLLFNRLFLDEFLLFTRLKDTSAFSSKTSKTGVASRSRAVSAVSHN